MASAHPSALSRLLLLLCHAAAVVADQAVIIERVYSGRSCSRADLYSEATFPAGRCIPTTVESRTAWGLELPYEAYISTFFVGTQLQACATATQARCEEMTRRLINSGMASDGAEAALDYTLDGFIDPDAEWCSHYVDANLYSTISGALGRERCLTPAENVWSEDLEGAFGIGNGRVSFEITTVPSPPSPVFITESGYCHTNAIPSGESGCMDAEGTEYELAWTQTNAVGECEPMGASYSQAWPMSSDFEVAQINYVGYARDGLQIWFCTGGTKLSCETGIAAWPYDTRHSRDRNQPGELWTTSFYCWQYGVATSGYGAELDVCYDGADDFTLDNCYYKRSLGAPGPPPGASEDSEGGFPVVAVIIAAGACALITVAVAAYCYCKKKKKKTTPAPTTPQRASMPQPQSQIASSSTTSAASELEDQIAQAEERKRAEEARLAALVEEKKRREAPPPNAPRFDPMTGQPIPKFDPNTGKQNW